MRPRQPLPATVALLPAALLTGTPAHAADTPAPANTRPGSLDWVTSTPAYPGHLDWVKCAEQDKDRSLRATLSGLREGIVAGVWRDFMFSLENRTDTAFEDVDIALNRYAYDRIPDPSDIYGYNNKSVTDYIDIEARDPETGAWTDVPFPDVQARLATDIAPRETLTFRFRLRIDETVPLATTASPGDRTGTGYVGVLTIRHVANLGCKVAHVDGPFRVHEPGTGTGAGVHRAGSSSAPALLALAGGAAVAVSAGAAYALRRRRAGAGED